MISRYSTYKLLIAVAPLHVSRQFYFLSPSHRVFRWGVLKKIATDQRAT